jgi:hypothetical protein
MRQAAPTLFLQAFQAFCVLATTLFGAAYSLARVTKAQLIRWREAERDYQAALDVAGAGRDTVSTLAR